MIKALLIPLILIICFGGGFVALQKPFNIKAVSVMVCLVVSIMVFGFATGITRLFGAIGLIVSLYVLFAIRGKK